MTGHFHRGAILRIAWLVAFLALVNSPRCVAEDARYERDYSRSKSDIEKLLRGLQTPAGSRLPILDGFVLPGLQPLERYGRAYYQYSFDILALNPASCRVRTTAKITAWYEDPDPSRSSYQLLKSNGRLEQDILDRLDESAGNSPSSPATPASKPAPKPASPANPAASSPGKDPNPVSRPGSSPATDAGAVFKLPPPLTSLPSRKESLSSNAPRTAEEQRTRQLELQARDLEEILRNQAHPNNLLVVKHPRTPVAARPSAAADIVLITDIGDEFPVLDRLGSWVHIQVSGIARGWVQSSDVDLPTSAKGTTPKATGGDPSDSQAKEPFVRDREETTTFPGDWSALRGKSVRVVWVRPSSDGRTSEGQTSEGQTSDARSRLAFARSLFRATFPQIADSPEAAGIVIVFDSADGGMAAATSATLKSWQAGSLSDTEFWKQCWFDPPEAFNATTPR